MGVCCSKLDDNDIELSPVVVDIDNLPEIPPTPPTPRTPEPEPVVEPEKPKWDGGRPRLTIPAQFLTPEQRAERAEADLASETEQRSLSSNTSDNGRSGRNDPMYKGAQTRGSMIAGAALGAKKIIVTDQLLGWLKKIPLLAKLSPPELKTLAESMTERTFRSGYKIIVEGDIGHECFILAKGSARVTKWQPEVRVEVELTTLTAGDIFGEAALLNEGVSQRGATITSTGPCHCFLLSRERFRTLLGKERLNVQFQKRAAISDNVGAANKLPQMPAGQRGGVPGNRGSTITSAPPGAMKHKNAATQAMLLKVVKDSVLFANVDEPQMKGIVDTMWLRYVAAGEIIIQQGDIGEHWYVIDNGAFDILITPKGGGPMTNVGTRERGAGVGELALLYNAPRAATIRASRAGAVWVLDRFTYRTIMTSAAEEKRARYEAFLKGVKGFDVLIASERAKLADALEEVSFDAGVAIVTEGEMGDTFYIILSGVVVVSKQREGELIRLKEGDYFGERAVVKNEPRAATCTASTKVTCLFLKSEAFKDLLGSMDEIFQQRQDIYKTMLASAQAKSGSSPADLEKVALEAEKAAEKAAAKSAKLQAEKDMAGGKKDKHLHDHGEGGQLSHLKLDDLKVIGTLGKGSFGTVQLVKEKGGSGATYALKIVSKQAVVDLGQQEHIMNEKRCMSQLNHPFLVRLFATFKDADRLYFLQEACLGGELFTVLRAKSSFPESVARFYAASVVLAFEYMHAKSIIYRDLKPENLLLDSKGYLKVTDYGFAKRVGDGRTWTLCGTPDYLAPEVVSGQGHGKAVDWWTLGILIFEMIAGYPPFYDEDPMKTYGRIMSGQFSFPMHFSKQAMDLIRKLLNPKAGKRYGVLAGGATLIKNHPWFAKFDWSAFLARRMPAPIIQPVKSTEDLSNFDLKGQDQTLENVKYNPPPGTEPWDRDF